jgi:hemerythrin
LTQIKWPEFLSGHIDGLSLEEAAHTSALGETTMRTLSLRLKHLSQEHQAAAKLAQTTRMAAVDDDDVQLADCIVKLCTVFDSDLEPHFREEEEHALPVLRQVGRGDLADKTLADHHQLRELVAQMRLSPSRALIYEFSNQLQAHVTFEEDVVWDVLDQALLTTSAGPN